MASVTIEVDLPPGVEITAYERYQDGHGFEVRWPLPERCRCERCGHEEKASDSEGRKCPEHGVRLWPKPIVRRLTFHHLRHTAGSHFLMSGVPLEVVQKMLRHTDPKITSGVYGHLLMSYQRDAIAKARLLSPEVLASWGAEPHRAAPGAGSDLPLADSLLTGVAVGVKKAGTAKQTVLER